MASCLLEAIPNIRRKTNMMKKMVMINSTWIGVEWHAIICASFTSQCPNIFNINHAIAHSANSTLSQ